jgi:hydroxymethylpyrimidine pyrophosphatase-like HAD family hydrolase
MAIKKRCKYDDRALADQCRLLSVLNNNFPELNSHQVLTVGDSPNNEAMFDADLFPISVGVANVRHYQDQMLHLPKYLTQASEFAGFSELAKLLLQT